MNRLEVRRHVAASLEAVFTRAADFANAADTISAITKMEMLTEGPVGVGTRFRETRLMFGREATEEMTVAAFDPPRSYLLHAQSHGSDYRSQMSFEPNGDGTDVVMTFEATPLTLVAKVMSIIFKPMMKSMGKMILKDLDDLKAAVEGESATSC